MKLRTTPVLSVLSALAIAVIGACAGEVVDDGSGSTPIAGDGGAGPTNDGASSTTTGNEDTGTGTNQPPPTTTSDGGSATFVDSGPPATIGGNDAGTQDSGSGQDAGLPAGDCNSLNDCPYQNATGVSGVSCDTTNHVCIITCAGDNYDVNGVVTDGCEVANPCPHGNGNLDCPVEHATATATYLGSFDCNDGDSAQTVTGAVPSDDRTHTSPTVVAFDGTAGAAPTVFRINGSGGFCEDDIHLTLQMNAPSARLNCYSFVVTAPGHTYPCAQTDSTGLCQIQESSGSYSDGDDIYITVAKIDSCPATQTDDGAFTITGHL